MTNILLSYGKPPSQAGERDTETHHPLSPLQSGPLNMPIPRCGLYPAPDRGEATRSWLLSASRGKQQGREMRAVSRLSCRDSWDRCLQISWDSD